MTGHRDGAAGVGSFDSKLPRCGPDPAFWPATLGFWRNLRQTLLLLRLLEFDPLGDMLVTLERGQSCAATAQL
jgi:hypothetical protein